MFGVEVVGFPQRVRWGYAGAGFRAKGPFESDFDGGKGLLERVVQGQGLYFLGWAI